MALNLKRYLQFLFLASVLFIIVGFITGKISGESFTYISLTGTAYSILQILLVVIILIIGIAISTPALIGDLILLLLGLHFPLLNAIWNVAWHQVTLGWFWSHTSGSSILFGSLILGVVSLLAMRRRR